MKHMTAGNRKKLYTVNLILLLLAVLFAVVIISLSASLQSQKAAQRWKGENSLDFAQLSCFIPEDAKLQLSAVYDFRRAMLSKFTEAALDLTSDSTLFVDAWSTGGKVRVSSASGQGEVRAIAVGGSFFNFHPLNLLDGSYINEGDLMQDRVLLDEDTAWLLFGGTQLQGMSLKVNNVPFVVAGVIQRESDRASAGAYGEGMGIFMSYEAYLQLFPEAGISCYEFVMPEPVKNFSMNFAREKFPIGEGEIIQNTGRYSPAALLKVVGSFGKRAMQTHGVIYPYWENAARFIEDWCALLLVLAMLACLLPALTAVLLIIRLFRRGRTELEEVLVPKLIDSTGEAIRVRQRRLREKRQGAHDKKK